MGTDGMKSKSTDRESISLSDKLFDAQSKRSQNNVLSNFSNFIGDIRSIQILF